MALGGSGAEGEGGHGINAPLLPPPPSTLPTALPPQPSVVIPLIPRHMEDIQVRDTWPLPNPKLVGPRSGSASARTPGGVPALEDGQFRLTSAGRRSADPNAIDYVPMGDQVVMCTACEAVMRTQAIYRHVQKVHGVKGANKRRDKVFVNVEQIRAGNRERQKRHRERVRQERMAQLQGGINPPPKPAPQPQPPHAPPQPSQAPLPPPASAPVPTHALMVMGAGLGGVGFGEAPGMEPVTPFEAPAVVGHAAAQDGQGGGAGGLQAMTLEGAPLGGPASVSEAEEPGRSETV
jgi:hypothetical protein